MNTPEARVLIAADLRPFIEVMHRAAEILSRFHVPMNGRARWVDQHHPRPLPFDGHEYRRRQRSRRRR